MSIERLKEALVCVRLCSRLEELLSRKKQMKTENSPVSHNQKQLSPEEQSQLVWQYKCSVPIILLEDFFAMDDFLSFFRGKEDILLEVVVSYIQHKEIHSADACNVYIISYQFLNGLSSSTDLLKLFPSRIQYEQEEQFKGAGLVDTNGVEGPFKALHLCVGSKSLDIYHKRVYRGSSFKDLIKYYYYCMTLWDGKEYIAADIYPRQVQRRWHELTTR